MTAQPDYHAQLERALKRSAKLAERILKDKDEVCSPGVAAGLLIGRLHDAEQEELWVLLLDTRNRLIAPVQVYRGSLNASAVRIADIFREAIRQNAAAIVVGHNHPSGDPSPSPEDVAITRALVEAGKLLDVEVLDHVVIGKGQYRSLKAAGAGFGP